MGSRLKTQKSRAETSATSGGQISAKRSRTGGAPFALRREGLECRGVHLDRCLDLFAAAAIEQQPRGTMV